jgi:hypothetical protein
MSGWTQRDSGSLQRTVVGILTDVHAGKPKGVNRQWWPFSNEDGDTGIKIRPNPPFHYLLVNEGGNQNEDGNIECEINVWPPARSEHGNWVDSMRSAWPPASEVTAVGIWVEDLGHDNKTELHPVDIVFGRVHESLISEKWQDFLGKHEGLKLDHNMYLFRFAIATDGRALYDIDDDDGDGRPPLAWRTRPVTFTPELPPPPSPQIPQPQAVPFVPSWAMREHLTYGEIIEMHDAVRFVSGKEVLDITITPKSLTQEEFRADPSSPAAVLLGEFVTFWAVRQPEEEGQGQPVRQELASDT